VPWRPPAGRGPAGGSLTAPTAGLTVVHADAATLRLPRRPFQVVASPSYGISARLLSLLLAPGARRWARSFTATAGPPPRRAFRPAPHVDSAILIRRRR
jgi:23S rRNA (adenine-N6)-dimethyltransferase